MTWLRLTFGYVIGAWWLMGTSCSPPAEPTAPLPPVQDPPTAAEPAPVVGATGPAPVPEVEPNPAPPPLGDPAPANSGTSIADSVVAAADRSDADRALDDGRQPANTLRFFGITSGMRVAELGAGSGYTSELLARVVGSSGKVYAQNNQFILERFAEGPLSERLEKPVMSNVVRIDREFDTPLPPEAKDLDAVLIVLFYHDTVWFGVDRLAMNRAVFAALKPGGVYGIVDHSAAAGAGTSAAKSLHRIEESVVKAEVESVGFRLEASADFLRNPKDPRDWNASPGAAGDQRGTSDRFVLKFVKPL